MLPVCDDHRLFCQICISHIFLQSLSQNSVINQIISERYLDYKSKARYGHIHLAMQKAKTMEERKAVSLNVMHENTDVTDKVHQRMPGHEAQNIITRFSFDTESTAKVSDAENELLNLVSQADPQIIQNITLLLQSLMKL